MLLGISLFYWLKFLENVLFLLQKNNLHIYETGIETGRHVPYRNFIGGDGKWSRYSPVYRFYWG